MKNVNQITPAVTSNPPSMTTPAPLTFSEHERDVAGYFFLRLKNIYGSKFDQAYPSEEALQMAKREYAKSIGRFTRDQLHQAFEQVKLHKQNCIRDFEWPDVDQVLSLITPSWECRAHKPFTPENKLEDLTGKERSKEIGCAALDDILRSLA